MVQVETLKQAILDIFLECFDMRIESPELDLLEARFVDSLRVVELVLEIEQRFGVSLPFEELEIEDFRTVSRLAERVMRTPVAAG
jgi:acyl carrier protein